MYSLVFVTVFEHDGIDFRNFPRRNKTGRRDTFSYLQREIVDNGFFLFSIILMYCVFISGIWSEEYFISFGTNQSFQNDQAIGLQNLPLFPIYYGISMQNRFTRFMGVFVITFPDHGICLKGIHILAAESVSLRPNSCRYRQYQRK